MYAARAREVSPTLSYATARLFWSCASSGFSLTAFSYRKSASCQKPLRAIVVPYELCDFQSAPVFEPEEHAPAAAAARATRIAGTG